MQAIKDADSKVTCLLIFFARLLSEMKVNLRKYAALVLPARGESRES